jgi:hypothetical protein
MFIYGYTYIYIPIIHIECMQAELASLWIAVQDLNKLDVLKEKKLAEIAMERDQVGILYTFIVYMQIHTHVSGGYVCSYIFYMCMYKYFQALEGKKKVLASLTEMTDNYNELQRELQVYIYVYIDIYIDRYLYIYI